MSIYITFAFEMNLVCYDLQVLDYWLNESKVWWKRKQILFNVSLLVQRNLLFCTQCNKVCKYHLRQTCFFTSQYVQTHNAQFTFLPLSHYCKLHQYQAPSSHHVCDRSQILLCLCNEEPCLRNLYALKIHSLQLSSTNIIEHFYSVYKPICFLFFFFCLIFFVSFVI